MTEKIRKAGQAIVQGNAGTVIFDEPVEFGPKTLCDLVIRETTNGWVQPKDPDKSQYRQFSYDYWPIDAERKGKPVSHGKVSAFKGKNGISVLTARVGYKDKNDKWKNSEWGLTYDEAHAIVSEYVKEDKEIKKIVKNK